MTDIGLLLLIMGIFARPNIIINLFECNHMYVLSMATTIGIMLREKHTGASRVDQFKRITNLYRFALTMPMQFQSGHAELSEF